MEFKGEEKRQHFRRTVTIQVRYRSLESFFSDYALNISYGGIFIKTRRPLTKGSPVELEFDVPGVPRPFRTSGRVARVILPGEDENEPSGMGIEFNPLSEEDKALVDTIIQSTSRRCPNCGLVHTPLDKVCRRCEIDLRTGEPSSRVDLQLLPQAAPSLTDRLRQGVKLGRGQIVTIVQKTNRPRSAKPARKTESQEPASPPQPAVSARAKAAPLVQRLRVGAGRIVARVRGRLQSPELDRLECVQCTGPMSIQRALPFARSGPVALLILGAVLVGAGIFYHLLWITAAASIIAGAFYLRLGDTRWQCSACGFSIPRA